MQARRTICRRTVDSVTMDMLRLVKNKSQRVQKMCCLTLAVCFGLWCAFGCDSAESFPSSKSQRFELETELLLCTYVFRIKHAT